MATGAGEGPRVAAAPMRRRGRQGGPHHTSSTEVNRIRNRNENRNEYRNK